MLAGSQHSTDLHKLLIASGLALGIMAIPAMTLGWLVAGRYLRPLRTITATARDISATNLHERLNLAGPQDELKQLGDTFDDLLARLERSFQSERRFIANASHELRTPLATMRASLDVAMAKPGPLPAPTVTLADRLRPELDHIDRLLENFLTLAHTQQGTGIDQCTVSLSALASAAIERCSAGISVAGLKVSQEHNGPEAWVEGSQILLSRMVDNVIDNAIKHNQPGGWIGVKTTVDGVAARLVVENGGTVLAQDDVQDLTRPFRRRGTERTGSERGSGLGLSIVEAIAEAHSGTVLLRARQDGGLQVTVVLPLAPTPVEGHPT
jgi:signal transduction histidine kinase